MDLDVLISDLNSYFELLVAFTLAYGGIESFQNSINKYFLSNFNDKYIKEVEIKLKKLTGEYVILEAGDYFQSKLSELKLHIKNMESLKREAIRVLDGIDFRAMFYLIGLFYMTTIVVGGFQKIIGDITSFFIVLLSSVLVMLYSVFISTNLLRNSKGKKITPYFSYFNSPSYVLACFIFLFPLIVVFSYSTCCDIHETMKPFAFSAFIASAPLGLLSHDIVLNKAVILLLAIVVPVFPYFRFYRRKKYLEQFRRRIEEEYTKARMLSEALQETVTLVNTSKETSPMPSNEKANTHNSSTVVNPDAKKSINKRKRR
jgi:hypothetical protein